MTNFFVALGLVVMFFAEAMIMRALRPSTPDEPDTAPIRRTEPTGFEKHLKEHRER